MDRNSSKTALIISPMPLFPTTAGNRQRALALCKFLRSQGFIIDLAIVDHEDRIYRNFDVNPPNDLKKTQDLVDEIFYIETKAMTSIKTTAKSFMIDEWYPSELGNFYDYYIDKYDHPDLILVNYVFYSKILEKKAKNSIGVIDTHDRFSGRAEIYKKMRQEPNFFYTTNDQEKIALDRADAVLAIQDIERNFFLELTDTPVITLNHLPEDKAAPPSKDLKYFVFIGHGNDVNFISISQFIHAWASAFSIDGEGPTLAIAGEVGRSFGDVKLPNVKILGYVDDLDLLYSQADAMVAPLVFGTGLKVKVVEALARGKIIIGTSIAFEGIDSNHESHNFDSQAAMIAYIKSLDAGDVDILHEVNNNVWREYRHRVSLQEKTIVDFIGGDAGKSSGRRTPGRAMSEVRNATETSSEVYCWIDESIVVWIEEAPITFVNDTRVERRIADFDVTGYLVATEHRATGDLGRSTADNFSISRSRIYVGRITDAIKIDKLSQIQNFELITTYLNDRRFYMDSYIQDVDEDIIKNQKFLELIYQIGIRSLDWKSKGQMIGLDKSMLTFVAVAPSSWAQAGKLRRSDCIVRYSDQSYNFISEKSLHYINDEIAAREVGQLNSGYGTNIEYSSRRPLIPVEIKLKIGNSDNRKLVASVMLRKSTTIGLVDMGLS